MKSRRLFFFSLAILLGIGAGLAFGWLVMPPKAPTDASMTDLRIDYQTDLVLMVAESFSYNSDSALALDQLAEISNSDPFTLIGTSLSYADSIGYPHGDMDLLENLLTGLDLAVYQDWKNPQTGD